MAEASRRERTPSMDMRAAAHASMGSEYVKSLVFGGLDGIITTFAVVCAACGAELGARVIVLMGVANLFADGISMGVGDYLSERAEEDCARSVRRHEEAAMRAARAATRARLAAVYRAKYFADAADDDDDAQGRADAVVDALLACGERAVIDALLAVEHGILSDEDDADGSAPRPAGLSAAARKGLVTGAAFIVFGAVPLGVFLPRALGSAALADALGLTAARVFPLSMVATSATLFGLGVCKGRVARQRPVWAGGEMLLNGLAAATAAYVIGFVADGIVGADTGHAAAAGGSTAVAPPWAAGAAVARWCTAAVPDSVSDYTKSIAVPFLMSLLAGLATTLGGFAACLTGGNVSPDFKAFMLSLAVGVMLAVSVLELLMPSMRQANTQQDAGRIAVAALLGAAAAFGLGRIVPLIAPAAGDGDDGAAAAGEKTGPATPARPPAPSASDSARRKSASATGVLQRLQNSSAECDSPNSAEGKRTRAANWRLAILMTVSLTAHNLPEGLAVAVSTHSSCRSGAAVALAVALHNIPEGFVIALPVLAATGSKRKALALTLMSGLSEPTGALLGLLFLNPFITSRRVEGINSFVAGVMIWISCCELFPEAAKLGSAPMIAAGVLVGALVIYANALVI